MYMSGKCMRRRSDFEKFLFVLVVDFNADKKKKPKKKL